MIEFRFMVGRFMIGATFLHKWMEKFIERKVDLHMVFIDLEKVYGC